MDIPSSTVSRRISRLEADLNVKLLQRNSRKIHLTEKGKILYTQSAPLINQLRENTRDLTESIDDIHGKLKITAPTYIGNDLMADLFTEFVQKNPEIQLELLLSNDIEDLLDEEIDIAIRIGPLEDSSLIAQHLWDMDYVICAGPEYIKKNGNPSRPEELQQHRMIYRTHQVPLEFSRVSNDKTIKIEVLSHLISNDIKFSIHAVLNNAGIACLPRMFIRKEIKNGKLLELLTDYELKHSRAAYAVYPSKRYLPEKTRLLIECVRQRSLQLCAC